MIWNPSDIILIVMGSIIGIALIIGIILGHKEAMKPDPNERLATAVEKLVQTLSRDQDPAVQGRSSVEVDHSNTSEPTENPIASDQDKAGED